MRFIVFAATILLAGMPAAQERPKAERPESIIARALFRVPGDIASRNLKTGPDEPGAFPTGATISCTYLDRKLGGLSPKFACRTGDGDELKVKYGGTNGEVYAEVVTSRLLWALGYGADRMYSVRVVCRGCPEIAGSIRAANGDRIIDPAAVEREMPGVEILDRWSWKDLGPSDAERDAFRLLAVFLQHADSKPEQHRVICLEQPAADGRCERPLMMMHDVGITFGHAHRMQRRASMHLEEWAPLPVWRDEPGCVGNLGPSFGATLVNPVIGEAGRALLADLLSQLTDQQLQDMFAAARIQHRTRNPARGESGFPAVSEWVDAFKQKRAQIVDRRCPS